MQVAKLPSVDEISEHFETPDSTRATDDLYPSTTTFWVMKEQRTANHLSHTHTHIYIYIYMKTSIGNMLFCTECISQITLMFIYLKAYLISQQMILIHVTSSDNVTNVKTCADIILK